LIDEANRKVYCGHICYDEAQRGIPAGKLEPFGLDDLGDNGDYKRREQAFLEGVPHEQFDEEANDETAK